MKFASELDETRSVASEALRLAQTIPDPELAAILREIAVLFGAGDRGPATKIA